MNTYLIEMPITGVICREIVANSEKEAIALFRDTTTLPFGKPVDTDAEIIEWEMHEAIVRGNVFYGVRNEIEISRID